MDNSKNCIPSRDETKSTKSKRKAADIIVKQISEQKDFKLRKDCFFYIMLTKANIELIWCDEFEGQDAYTHPIYEHITNRSNWMIKNCFIGFYAWRESHTSNVKVTNVLQTKEGSPAYPRRYYLRIVNENESTPISRKEILMECSKVMTESSRISNNTMSPRKNIQKEYMVPPDYDRTPQKLEPLDHYLMNADVYNLIKSLYSDTKDWGKWATENEVDANCYFSPPHSCREAFLLGYLN